jgi:hypothetical protein
MWLFTFASNSAGEEREGKMYIIALFLPQNGLAVARWVGEVTVGTYGSPALCQWPPFLFLFASGYYMGLMVAILVSGGLSGNGGSRRPNRPSVGVRGNSIRMGTSLWLVLLALLACVCPRFNAESTRTYHVQAEPVDWDFAPHGNLCYEGLERVMPQSVLDGALTNAGGVWRKARQRELMLGTTHMPDEDAGCDLALSLVCSQAIYRAYADSSFQVRGRERWTMGSAGG